MLRICSPSNVSASSFWCCGPGTKSLLLLLADVRYWIRNIQANANQNLCTILVANKIDIPAERVVSSRSNFRLIVLICLQCLAKVSVEEGKKLAEECHVPYVEASAKSSQNVDEVRGSCS